MLRKQYSFLAKFAQDIKDGKLSPKQISARARLYIRSATAAFERGQLSAHGISSSLLQLPGDGQTECGVNCRCHLSITEDEHSWYVRWILDPDCKHCSDCPELARTWNPLVIKK